MHVARATRATRRYASSFFGRVARVAWISVALFSHISTRDRKFLRLSLSLCHGPFSFFFFLLFYFFSYGDLDTHPESGISAYLDHDSPLVRRLAKQIIILIEL